MSNTIIGRSGDIGLTISGPSAIDALSTNEITVSIDRLSVCNSQNADLQIRGVDEGSLSLDTIQARNTDFSNANNEAIPADTFAISDCNECFYSNTDSPSESPSQAPTPPPTQGPQRIRLLAGVQNPTTGAITGTQYLTVEDSLCNRYIEFNPPMEIRPKRSGDGADSQIFIYHPDDGALESLRCRGIYVSIGREQGRSCCTAEAHAGQSIESACEEGRIRLGTTLEFRTRSSSFGGRWTAHQAAVATSSTGNLPFFIMQNQQCTAAKGLSHSDFAEGAPSLGALGSGFSGLLWGFEPTE